MASVHHEITIAAAPEAVWDAARDVGALHLRLVPGFVVHTDMVPDAEPPVRLVEFASGAKLREVIVDSDDARRRLVWTIEADYVTHHNGVLQVFGDGDGGARVTWTADVLPHTIAATFASLMRQGLETMKRHFEAG